MRPMASLLSHPTSTKHRDHTQKPSLFAVESLLYSSDDEDVNNVFFGVKEEKKISTIEAPPQHTPIKAEKKRFDSSNARMIVLENIGSTKSEMLRSVSYCIGHKDPMLREQHAHADADTHMGMHRSLTDDDFFELKGCIDLGFRFDEASIPQLSHILPALEVCSAITQNFHEHPITISPPPWKVTNPALDVGDSPEDVKERLRHWAQAVACNLRLCH